MQPDSFERPWTRAEIRALRDAYPKGVAAAEAALPGRTRGAIMHKAARLGCLRRRRWTAHDDRTLAGMWGDTPLAAIARLLGRTTYTTYWRARKLGLQVGCPQGLEYITHAAIRTGFNQAAQLERILRWAGVRILPAFARRRAKAGWRMRVVDPLDVDSAIARWMRTETVQAAGRRHGTTADTMARWLREADVKLSRVEPERRTNRRRNWTRWHHRVESDVVDRVVSERRHRESSTETLSAAARRVGLLPHTLGRWLEEAGHRRQGYHWRVDPALVDQVVATRRERSTCRSRPRECA